jgi:pyridoxal phosphate enzyme (YggS family)
VALFDVIHTVDRLELAREIDKEARKAGKNQQVLWQVNISGEKTKSGAEAPSLEPLLREALKFENLSISGLMSIGSYVSPSESDELRRAEFRELRKLRSALENYLGVGLPDLSMGMSHDFELAIEEGATFVRVGSAIFGARSSQ